MTETVKEKPETVVVESRETMLVNSLEHHDKSVYEFEGNSGSRVWVIARTEQRARLACLDHLTKAVRRITQTEILKMCQQELYAKHRREAENGEL